MHKRALGLVVAVILGVVLVSASGAAATTNGPTAPAKVTTINVSTRAAVVHYLRSMHVNAKGVVIERGLRNYAGAHCPGKGWTCAGTRNTVVQIAEPGGQNRFACGRKKCAVVQFGGASRLHAASTASSPKPPPPPNYALCVKTTGITGSCVINQPSASGINKAVVWMVTPKLTGLTQSANYSASITQGPASATGSSNTNLACVKQFVWVDGSTTKTSATSTTVTNDNHELITVNQNSLTGTNTVQGAVDPAHNTNGNGNYDCDTSSGSQLQQDEVLTTVVNQKGGSITQNQNTLPSTTSCTKPPNAPGCANVVTDIEQNQGVGFLGVAGQGMTAGTTQNTAAFEQSTKQVAIANTPSGTVNQQQNASVPLAPYSGIVGTINQDSTHKSTVVVNQDETQCQDAVNVAAIPAPTSVTALPQCPVLPEHAPPASVSVNQKQYGPEGVGVLAPSNSAGRIHANHKGYGQSLQTNAGAGVTDTFGLIQHSSQSQDFPILNRVSTLQTNTMQGDCTSSGNALTFGGACAASQSATLIGGAGTQGTTTDGYTAGGIGGTSGNPPLVISCTNGHGTCQPTPPPAPVIDGGSKPPSVTDSRSVQPTWTDTADGSVTYKCAITGTGGQSFTQCSSNDLFSGLGTGSHTFKVEAIDNSPDHNVSAFDSFTWTIVDLSVSLSPGTSADDATTASPTLTTCTIQQDTGSGPVAAVGATCVWSVTGGPNNGVTNSCVTGSGGTCTFSYSDAHGTGTDTIHATTTFSVSGLSMIRATGDGIRSDGSDVSKTWVDANISITPQTKANEVGTSHTFTVTVLKDLGGGSGLITPALGETVTTWIVNSNGATSTMTGGTCGNTAGTTGSGTTSALGTCTIIINGPTTGTVKAYASVGVQFGTTTVNRDSDSTTASVGHGPGGTDEATKTWVVPTVTNVTSTDGTYVAGDPVAVQVTFSEPVVVDDAGGTPSLALDSGGTAIYSSGSGTNTLTFNYTVAAGQNSADLDYTTPSALSLNGGTIKDNGTNTNAAVLALAAPGAATSLGANNAIVIDTAPVVTNVTSSNSDNTYAAGDTVLVQVTFSEPVVVDDSGGTPSLALDSGGTAIYSSGGGTTMLTFKYVVQSGDSSFDLDYTSSTALSSNGGTIDDTDGVSNAAVLTLAAPGAAGSLGANKDIVISG